MGTCRLYHSCSFNCLYCQNYHFKGVHIGNLHLLGNDYS